MDIATFFAGVNANTKMGERGGRDRNANRNKCEHGLSHNVNVLFCTVSSIYVLCSHGSSMHVPCSYCFRRLVQDMCCVRTVFVR